MNKLKPRIKISAFGQKILVSFSFTSSQLHTTLTTFGVSTPIEVYLALVESAIHFSK